VRPPASYGTPGGFSFLVLKSDKLRTMATSPSLISVQDYVRDYVSRETKPMCEYVEGVLVPKGMGTFAHARAQARLAALLQGFGFEVFVELHGRLREAEFRVPDVVLMKPGTTQGDYPGPDNPNLFALRFFHPIKGLDRCLLNASGFTRGVCRTAG